MTNEADGTHGLASGRFEGRETFRQLIRDGLACAAREGWREIVLCDATFDDWPLGERAVTESLQAWASGTRKFVILAKNYDEVVRKHPRFVSWRRLWSHIIDARGCADADPLGLPSMLLGPGWVLERLDPQRSTGYSGAEPERRLAARESLQEWLRKSTSAFPATNIGL